MNASLYQVSQFRMGISAYSTSNFSVFGLTVNSTGGDGLYFGNDPAYNGGNQLGVHVKDFVADNNNRQGLR